jgi:hypothetical protein
VVRQGSPLASAVSLTIERSETDVSCSDLLTGFHPRSIIPRLQQFNKVVNDARRVTIVFLREVDNLVADKVHNVAGVREILLGGNGYVVVAVIVPECENERVKFVIVGVTKEFSCGADGFTVRGHLM